LIHFYKRSIKMSSFKKVLVNFRPGYKKETTMAA